MFGCKQCIPIEPTTATSLGLELVVHLVGESHFGVSIRRCATCGQQFAWVFTETIDWDRGEDPQCTTVMPLTEGEAAGAIAHGERSLADLAGIAVQRRFLCDDWPAS